MGYGRRKPKPANCPCEGSWRKKWERWVIIERGVTDTGALLLKCLECGWRWESRRQYAYKLPEWKERSRAGMTDEDILQRIKDDTLRVCTETAVIQSYNTNTKQWGELTQNLRESRGPGRGSYWFVSVCHKGKKKAIAVHRLVWMAANLRTVPAGYHVDHIHGTQAGDGIENLRLLEPAVNCVGVLGDEPF